ncbi:MAG: PKD domain-containing protein, partial [Chitinophagales bacterium]|nr:PKD domain-containing protein [Chitinophagales bacterium]
MRRIFTLILLLSACRFVALAQPNAQFTASQLFGCAPLVVQFTDQSTGGPTSWLWQFDNGNTSPIQNPTATFATGNIYNVRLIATNSSGSDTQTLQIRVFQPAAPNFTAPNNRGCVQPCHTVNFVNQTIPGESPVTQYVWDFGDGSLPVSGFNVTNCYTQPGSYQVTLVARDSNGCQTSKIIPNYVTISDGPTSSLTASPTLSCTAPLTVNFTGTGSSPNGGISYAWFFGNGNTSAQQNPTTTYQGGIYNPELVVSDALGCRSSSFGHIEVIVMQPRFVVSSNNGCTGIDLQFTDSSNYASSWNWDFGDGTTSTLQNPTHAYANVGNYTVTLAVSYQGCNGTYTQSTPINISVPVTPTFTANDTSNCTTPFPVTFTSTAPGAVSYDWSFGDGGTSNLANPAHTYTTNGSFDVSLSVANSSGCVNTLTYTGYIGVGALSVGFSIDSQQGCSPMLVKFKSSSTSDVPITSYIWNFGDGATVTAGDSTSHVYSGGTFTPSLTVINAEGCTDSINLAGPIRVGNALIPVFRATPLIQCVNQPVNFTNQTTGWNVNTQWLWLFGDGSTSTLQNPTHAYSDTGV